ncbi:MAG: hypothetical protein L0G70_04575 [Rubrobacter sp.]|nr:hypothetical protein [Rubrobacter sp.]
MLRDDLALLKKGLRTEIEQALAGEYRQSIVLLIRDDRLPMVRMTDERGVVTNKVASLVDVLGALDNSTTISQLRQDSTRNTDLPPLPQNTLLVSITERPEGRSFTVTGYVEPDAYVFLVEQSGTSRTFDIPLPHLVYRAVFEERRFALSALSLAVCSPRLAPDRSGQAAPENATNTAAACKPDASTQIFRYPFSNVYHSFGGISEGVCWPGLRQLEMRLDEVPEQAVKRFLRSQNNSDMYGQGLSHNAPYSGYCEFLAAIEEKGGLEEDHLIPTGATVEDLHYQRRPGQ